MNWTQPWILWLAPAVLLLEALLFLRRRKRAIPLPAASMIPARSTWRTTAVRAAAFLPPIALLVLLPALAGPMRIETRRNILPSGVDILVALDISGSMAAEDFQPQNRLAVAKDVLTDFIRGRPSDRIGLVLFAGRSVTRSPLTLQHEALIRTLEQVTLGSLPDGTAIGSAMMSGINRLRSEAPSDRKGSRLLLLITDGRNNAGQIHPLDALPIAKELKLRIYTVGVGSFGKVPFPVYTPDGKKTYQYEQADIDEPLLQKIAEETGGRYFRASDPDSLGGLFEQINHLEKSDPQITETRALTGLHPRFIVPALAIGIFYMLITIYVIRLP